MADSRDFAMLHTQDQWFRAAYKDTAFNTELGAVELAWQLRPSVEEPAGTLPPPAGLAFDPWCRLYRSLPEAGRVERLLWSVFVKATGGEEVPAVTDLFEVPPEPRPGEFVVGEAGAGSLDRPLGLAVDDDGRLFLAERGRSRILIFDLVERRLLRRVPLPAPPLDLSTDGERVRALLEGDPRVATLDARREPVYRDLPLGVTDPSRIAVSPLGDILVLTGRGTEDARIVPLARPDESLNVSGATDIEFMDDDVLAVARLPGQDFARFVVRPGLLDRRTHLSARGYDGRGIARTPDGRILFWTANGPAHAALARVRYTRVGRVVGYRLDSGEYQTIWGRLFLDACLPKGTDVRAWCLATDEPPEDLKPLKRDPPANLLEVTIARPDLSPMPPESLVKDVQPEQGFHRRETGPEFPWLCREPDDVFRTYEAPTANAVGRYLWVVLELRGTSRTTPRVRSLRAEYPAHDLLYRLPKVYSRDAVAADFLRRYLGIMEGSLRDLDLKAGARHALLDPRSAPAEMLPWLAGFIGLALDSRWPEAARRELIRRGTWLFRFRGTVPGLKSFLEIYLGREVFIVEHFKVRGLGGALVGEDSPLSSGAVLGAGFRIGGALGEEVDVGGTTATVAKDAFETHAHRFSVVVPMFLDQEQRDVIAHILDVHRPAHTLYDICSVDTGMRVGIGLYTQLTTIVGRGAGFDRLQVGGSLLGRHAVLGRPGPGTRIGGSRLGGDSRVA